MKTEFRTVPHPTIPDTTIVEIWRAGLLLGTIEALPKGPGIRIVSEHKMIMISNDGSGVSFEHIPSHEFELRMGVMKKPSQRVSADEK